MIISNLLTKYILASFWIRIFIFLLFYVAIRQLHFLDSDFSVVECMPRKRAAKVIFEAKEEVKQSIPLIAETKSIGANSKSIFQREVEYFCGFTDVINEQKSLLKTQQFYINDLEADLKLSEEKNLHLKDNVKRITSKYLDQEYEIKRVKAYNQQLYSENVSLRKHILKLEEELKQLR